MPRHTAQAECLALAGLVAAFDSDLGFMEEEMDPETKG
jgi:hypothetical protein